MDTASTIKAYVEKTLVLEEGRSISADDSLLDSGLLDSTGIFELVMFLETEFGAKIDDEDIVPEHFETVGAIAEFIDSKREGA